MKRIILVAMLMVVPVLADEEPKGEGQEVTWKWVNFIVLAGGLGYLISKKGGAFFGARNAEIQKNIAEAHKLKEEAEARLAEAEGRLAGLEVEIRALRESARQESAAEAERLRCETEQEMAKIRAHAEVEIEAAVKSARLQLKIHAGQLATDLARRKILARLSPQADAHLVDRFVNSLHNREARL